MVLYQELGIPFLFIIPAFSMPHQKDNKKLVLSCGLLFLIAELILFQPNDYDNNKLFYIAYMIAVIIVSEYLVLIYNKLKGINLRGFLALVIISATLSGVMTIIREYHSGAMYQTYAAPLILKLLNISKTTPTQTVCL